MVTGSSWHRGIIRHRKATERLTMIISDSRQNVHTAREQFILHTEAHNEQRLAENAFIQQALLSHDARLAHVHETPM